MNESTSKPTVYLETTIPSYLTAWRSKETSMAGKQDTTREWWDERRDSFDLYVSDAILMEASSGDADAARKRLEVLEGIPILETTSEVSGMARELIAKLHLPDKAAADAVHIGLCAIHGMDYLLTWNCTHIANATFLPLIDAVCESFEVETPIICTPDQLMGTEYET